MASAAFEVECDYGGRGSLALNRGTVQFTPAEEHENHWVCKVRDVEDVKVSRKGAKIRMKVRDVGAQRVVTVGFASPEARDAAAAAITAHRGIVVESDISGVPKLDPERAKRAAALTNDPQLRALHATIVQDRKWVTDDEFWRPRRHLLDTDQPRPMRSAHFSRELLAEHASDSGVYRFSKQLTHDIFSEYPAVEKVYRRHVLGAGMAESAFWSQFLASPYFRSKEARGARRVEQRNIFDGILQADIDGSPEDDNTPPPKAPGGADSGGLKAPAEGGPAVASGSAALLSGSHLEEASALGAQGYGVRRPAEWVGSDGNMPAKRGLLPGGAGAEGDDAGLQVGRRFNKHSAVVLRTASHAAQTGRNPSAVTDDLDDQNECSIQRALTVDGRTVVFSRQPNSGTGEPAEETAEGTHREKRRPTRCQEEEGARPPKVPRRNALPAAPPGAGEAAPFSVPADRLAGVVSQLLAVEGSAAAPAAAAPAAPEGAQVAAGEAEARRLLLTHKGAAFELLSHFWRAVDSHHAPTTMARCLAASAEPHVAKPAPLPPAASGLLVHVDKYHTELGGVIKTLHSLAGPGDLAQVVAEYRQLQKMLNAALKLCTSAEEGGGAGGWRTVQA
ncbi:putative RNA polymerase II transcription factor B subunit 1-3 [Diplonema papillatum]|nr:putative RNA polymerase II transcription factor B subunit 1-3 [Diplonema papillatum]